MMKIERVRVNQLKEWWNTIKIGELSGNPPSLLPIGPDLFLHLPDKTFPLTFTRYNGLSYYLNFRYDTDLGSIPGLGRVHPRLTKTYYTIAYLFHDVKYTISDIWSELTFEENNLMCIEIIKTLQIKGYLHYNYFGGPAIANIIYTGISTSRKSYDKTNSN